MATVKGVNKTLIDTGGIDSRLAKGTNDARVKCCVDTYEAAAIAAGTVIEMCGDLPIGARIQEIVLHTDDLGNNVTLAVGDAEDDNRYITATDHGAGAELITRLNAIAGRDYEIDNTTATTPDTQILITTAVAAATGTIKLAVYYTQD